MTNEPDNLADNLLERATSALRDTAVPPGPPASVLAKTLSALEAAQRPHQTLTLKHITLQQRIRAMNAISKLAVAASLLITVGGIFLWTLASSPSVAFADVLKEVRSIQSVQYRVTQTRKIDEPVKAGQSMNGRMLISGPLRMRFTTNQGVIMTFDMKLGKSLVIDPKTKVALLGEMANFPYPQMNFVEGIKNMPENAGKPIGKKQIGGVAAEGFDVAVGDHTHHVWVSEETRLPILVEIETSTQSIVRAPNYTLDEFVWNPSVDEAAISLVPPEGYRVDSASKIDMALPKETDIVAGFKAFAELNGGSYPGAIDMAGFQESSRRRLARTVKEWQLRTSTGEPQKANDLRESLAVYEPGNYSIIRMLVYMESPKNGSDWHYAGGGVKVGQADRPILWYRPAGSDKYRVINADLSVHDVAAADLPRIPSTLIVHPAQMPGPTTQPQSSNANTDVNADDDDPRQSSVLSTVATVRAQLELYKLQHGEAYPTAAGLWDAMTKKTSYAGQMYGPYLSSAPVNPFNQSSTVGTAAAGTTHGWALVPTNLGCQFCGLGKDGTWIEPALREGEIALPAPNDGK